MIPPNNNEGRAPIAKPYARLASSNQTTCRFVPCNAPQIAANASIVNAKPQLAATS